MRKTEKNFLSLIGFWALCCTIISLQIVSLPILQYVFPQRGNVEPMLLATLFFGMAAGEVVQGGSRNWRMAGCLVGAVLVVVALFFSSVMLFALTHGWARTALLALLIAGNFRLGQLMVSAIYFSKSAPVSYEKINLLLMALVPLAVVFMWAMGIHALLGLAGITFCAASLAQTGENEGCEAIKLVKADITSFLFGLAASLYLVIAFRIYYLALWPVGLEFPLYLFVAFGLLACSTYFARTGLLRISSGTAVLLGAGLFFLELLLTTSERIKGASFLWHSTYAAVLPVSLQPKAFLIVEFLVILLFLLPYFFWASLFSLRERETAEKNHLFSLSLGNATGYFLAAVLLPSASVFLVATVFLLLVLAGVWSHGGRKLVVLSLMLACAWIVAAPRDLDLRFVRQSKTLLPRGRVSFSFDRQRAASWESIHRLFFRDGGVGYVIEDGGERKFLGLGGYVAQINSDYDIVTGHVAAELGGQGKSILILGLGNRVILNILADRFPDSVIDVVDNFGPFLDPEFLAKINQGQRRNYRLIYDDIFPFLASKQNEYDIIVGNITLPTYFSAKKLYTDEFTGIVRRALKPDGMFISEAISDAPFRCRLLKEFKYVQGYPRDTIRPQAAMVAADRDLHLEAHGDPFPWPSCDGVRVPTLGRPFGWGDQLLTGGLSIGKNAVAIPQKQPPHGRQPGYLEGLSLAFSQTGRPIVLDILDSSRKHQLVNSAGKELPALEGAYFFEAPDWLSSAQKRWEATVLMQSAPRLRLITDRPPEELIDMNANDLPAAQLLSLRSAPLKGVRSVLDLSGAWAAIPGESTGDSEASDISFSARLDPAVEAELRSQLSDFRVPAGQHWRIEVSDQSGRWPRPKPGEYILRLLTRGERNPILPAGENQFLLPLVDPACAGMSLDQAALRTALHQEDLRGPQPGEIRFLRGGTKPRSFGSRYRFTCP